MKCIKLEEAGIDVCVTVHVKTIFMEKSSGELQQAFERLETERLLRYLGVRHEGAIAEAIVREFGQRQREDGSA